MNTTSNTKKKMSKKSMFFWFIAVLIVANIFSPPKPDQQEQVVRKAVQEEKVLTKEEKEIETIKDLKMCMAYLYNSGQPVVKDMETALLDSGSLFAPLVIDDAKKQAKALSSIQNNDFAEYMLKRREYRELCYKHNWRTR